jgi:hypothetical protein
MAGCELLPVFDPLLLEGLLPLFAVVARGGPEKPVIEKMTPRISAKAVNVAKTISAGDPRQNLLLVCGCEAPDVK